MKTLTMPYGQVTITHKPGSVIAAVKDSHHVYIPPTNIWKQPRGRSGKVRQLTKTEIVNLYPGMVKIWT